MARFQKKYEPVQRELSAALARFGREGQEEQAFQFFRELKEGRARVSPSVKPVLDNALSDRTLLKHRDYVLRVLGDEERLFAAQPDLYRTAFENRDVLIVTRRDTAG